MFLLKINVFINFNNTLKNSMNYINVYWVLVKKKIFSIISGFLSSIS
jgi:hypothetical protein